MSNCFSDLKRQVDLTIALKQNEKQKYLEIINKIDLIEQECYNKIKPFNTFNSDIQLIEQQKTKNYDEIKYKIENKLFNNKSIFFYGRFWVKKRKENNSFKYKRWIFKNKHIIRWS